MCVAFNNPGEVAISFLKPSLHYKFKVQIECDTKDVVLTQDKCDNIMNTMKKKVCTIKNRYNRRGNGPDMVKFDNDTDDEDDGE